MAAAVHESVSLCVCHCPDKRTDPWLLVYSPVPVALIFLLYLCVVWLGPRLMRHRQPVDLRVVLIVYNFAMVGLSAYMFHEVCVERGSGGDAAASVASPVGLSCSSWWHLGSPTTATSVSQWITAAAPWP